MTNGIQLLRSSSLFSGAPYAYAAQAPPGSRFVFNMELALAAAAASITDVIFTRILVVTNDRDDLRNVWTVVGERFGDHDVPSTLVGVTVLGYRDQLVEIEAVAALSDAVPAECP